jgi:hypothetical protein
MATASVPMIFFNIKYFIRVKNWIIRISENLVILITIMTGKGHNRYRAYLAACQTNICLINNDDDRHQS